MVWLKFIKLKFVYTIYNNYNNYNIIIILN